MNYLNRWQRLAIVITAIYLLFAVILSVHSYLNFKNSSPSSVKRKHFFAIFTPFDNNEISTYKKLTFENCLKNGISFEGNNGEEKKLSDDSCRSFSELDIGQMTHKSPNYFGFLIALVFLPVIFWLTVWSFTKVIKWVLAGKSIA